LVMSKHPSYGISQHGESPTSIDRPRYGHLGKKIPFDRLPPECQECVMVDYRELWGSYDAQPGV
jgi:hypothetical protein